MADSEVQMGFLSLGTPTASKLPPELGDLFLSSAACWEESLFALLLMIPIEHRICPPHLGFTGGSDGKESACHAGDLGSISGLGRSPGRGHGSPLVLLPGESPWTGESGGPQSMGLQRVRHD